MNDVTVVTCHNPGHTRTVITVTGDMDVQTYPELEKASQAAAAIPLPGRTVQMDLSGVSFMDSSGLKLLLLLRRRLEAAGGHLTVTGLQHQPAALLLLTETHALLTAGAPRETPGHGSALPAPGRGPGGR
ncbi:STAS domain-containing protein [Streptomyces sp. WAC05292]|uniref:STAS domain-containing protein n=1 Tax=Streptomyces sp. WAC05292 TaxID=2487418 RepID=UPI001C8E9EF2|nr:STAS domain-containing protein [Streptomyces sp. WAC05292]